MEREHTIQPGMQEVLTAEEIDAVSEVMNISMGAAASAMSSMLDQQVMIDAPQMQIRTFEKIDYSAYTPAMLVQIQFVEGVSGTNVMVFRCNDMQVILGLLMGNEEAANAEDFEFDELSMSAACEMMNQMMGAASTALSEILGQAINISTPIATMLKDNFVSQIGDVQEGDEVVYISYGLNIKDIMQSSFISVMPCNLAKSIITRLKGSSAYQESEVPAAAAPVQPAANVPVPTVQAATPAAPQPVQQAYAPPAPAAPVPTQPMYAPPAAQVNLPPMGEELIRQPSVPVKKAQFPDFSEQSAIAHNLNSKNMNLLMNVPLDVSVEIGKTKRKIKDIAEFGQGTVIELEKQAGAPVDIVVNGQLLAHGDVVVIGDNFGVRITEIVGAKDLMNSLENAE